MPRPPWITYLQPQRDPAGNFYVARVTNFGDPRCPAVACDLTTRMRQSDPSAQIFVLTGPEAQAMMGA